MSLLLDALKKTGQTGTDAAQATAAAQGVSRLMPEPASEAPPQLTLQSLPETPRPKITRNAVPDQARMSAHELFAAKPAQTRMRPGIVPLTLLAACLFAAGGGYYVWREISPAPLKQRPNPPPAPVAFANITPPAPAPTPLATAPKESAVIPGIQPVAEEHPAIKPRHMPVLANPITPAAVPKVAQPIRIEHTREVITIDPSLLAGYQAYLDGNLDTARQQYSDALRKDANSRDALLGLAAIAQQQSQDDTAAQYYRQVLALDPRDPVAQAGMSALFGATDTAGTESKLKILLAQQPQSVALYFALGNHYAEQSRWSEAQQAYFEAARRAPDDGRIAFNLAVSLDQLNQGKLAAQHYRRALQLSPSDATDFNRAQVQQRERELISR